VRDLVARRGPYLRQEKAEQDAGPEDFHDASVFPLKAAFCALAYA
jgi:hypothetical protein